MSDPVVINKRQAKPHKAMIAANYEVRNVLTNSIWEFVTLWLKRNSHSSALTYWEQARYFARASASLPAQSAPLLHYYSFMNAAKALLVSRGITPHEHHGLRAHNMRAALGSIDLSNEGVLLLKKGICPSIANYLQDSDQKTTYSLKEILLNIPWVHRTYCLTYPTSDDLFIPLTECRYVRDPLTNNAYLEARIGSDFQIAEIESHLPASFTKIDDDGRIKCNTMCSIIGGNALTAADVAEISRLNLKTRRNIFYINGVHTLWYLKLSRNGFPIIDRSTITLTLMAMHRISEICRYRPVELASFLGGNENWLLTEFINLSSDQFFDEVASEITGHQFLAPNTRMPT